MAGVRRLGWLLTAALIGLTGCSGCQGGADQPAPASSGAPGAPDRRQAVLSVIDAIASCDLVHRGLLFDFGERPDGSDAMLGRYDGLAAAPAGITFARRGGQHWAQIYDRRLSFELVLQREAPIFVAMRAVGLDARRVAVSFDGVYLGSLALPKSEPGVVRTALTSRAAEPGMHRLSLRFSGRKRSDADPFAEIDWLRVGVGGDLEERYWAPTFDAALVPGAQLGGVPHRALALRAPGAVRCAVRVPAHAKLRLSVGVQGRGAITARVAVREDGADPVQLEQLPLDGKSGGGWRDLELSLHRFAGRVVQLELAAINGTGGGRLLFGDPVVDVPSRPPPPALRARAAVVVVLDGVDKSELPPWRPTSTPHLPVLGRLVSAAAVFNAHRGPATTVSAVVASLLSGRSPSEHSLADVGARLPKAVLTLAAFARHASVPAAMFTGVPTTFSPFGFADRWERFEQYPPNGGRLATAPLDDAVDWLRVVTAAPAGGRPVLAVVHARGGHPPWDVTPQEARKLPPPDYTGYLDPRRAAQLLARLRGHEGRMSGPDRERMRALYLTALAGQDTALGKLIVALRDAGRWDDTLLVVTGDVSSGRGRMFADGLPIDERLLDLPLLVRFPGGAHGGERFSMPTEMNDITATVVAALGLEPPPGLRGRDLASLVAGPPLGVEPLRVAYAADRYAARFGEWVLIGKRDARPSLCDLTRDPTCAYDHTDTHPLVRQALWRWLVEDLRAGPKAPTREPVALDSEAAAWLSVWGAD